MENSMMYKKLFDSWEIQESYTQKAKRQAKRAASRAARRALKAEVENYYDYDNYDNYDNMLTRKGQLLQLKKQLEELLYTVNAEIETFIV